LTKWTAVIFSNWTIAADMSYGDTAINWRFSDVDYQWGKSFSVKELWMFGTNWLHQLWRRPPLILSRRDWTNGWMWNYKPSASYPLVCYKLQVTLKSSIISPRTCLCFSVGSFSCCNLSDCAEDFQAQPPCSSVSVQFKDVEKKLPWIEDWGHTNRVSMLVNLKGPNPLFWFWHMMLTPLIAVVMSHAHARYQGYRSVGWKATLETVWHNRSHYWFHLPIMVPTRFRAISHHACHIC